MHRTLESLLRTTLLALATLVLWAPPAPAQEGGDDAYRFLAGLCEKEMWSVAAREGASFLESYPRHPKRDLARYRLATALFELDRKPEAAEEYRRLSRVRGFEYAAEVWFRLGLCEFDAGRDRPAAESFAQVIESGKDYLQVPARFFLAEVLFRGERFEDAERRYAECLAADPEGEYARGSSYGLAWCAFRSGDHERAIERIGSYLQRHGGSEGADDLRYLLGEAHLARGAAEPALEAFGSVRAGAFVESARRGQAFALAELGRHADAAGAFDRLLRAAPEGEHAAEARLHRGIEWLLAGDAVRAKAALSEPGLPDGGEASFWLARAQLETGDAEAALASAERGLRGAKGGELASRLRVLRGDALTRLGRADEAVRSYGEARTEYALYAGAIAALNAERFDEAGQLAGALLSEHPSSEHVPEMHVVVGEALFEEGDVPGAEARFRAALQAGPSDELGARAASRLAWCAYMDGRGAQAAERFGALLERFPASPEAEEATFVVGRCHEELGDTERAAAAFGRYLERFPGGRYRAEALLGLGRLDPEAGADRLRTLLAEDPDPELAVRAHLLLADGAARGGDHERAVSHYRAGLEGATGPAASEARYGLAWSLVELERDDEAAGVLSELLAGRDLDPELRTSALELKAWTASRAKDPDGALSAARAMLAAGVDEARAWGTVRTAAATLRAAERAREAQELLEGMLAEVESHEVAVGVLIESVWLALDAGSTDEAEASVRTAAKVARMGSVPAAELRRLAEASFFTGEARFGEERYPAAAQLFVDALEGSDGELHAQSLYKLGFSLLRVDEFVEAAKAFGRLIEEHPDSELFGEGLYLRGEALFRARRFEQAIEALARMKASAPRHEALPKALFRLGLAAGELGRWKEAADALGELARRAPEFPNRAEGELWRGKALRALGDARGARQALERVVAEDRTVLAARARLELGELHLDAGDAESALSEFLKVSVLFAHDDEVARAMLRAGDCMRALEDAEGARRQYLELVERHGETLHARAARERLRELGG